MGAAKQTTFPPEAPAQWAARSGWYCVGGLVLLDLTVHMLSRLLTPRGGLSSGLPPWQSALAESAFRVLYGSVSVLIAYDLSFATSPRHYARQLGLTRKPDLVGWCGAWGAVGLGLMGVFAVATGSAPPDKISQDLYGRGGLELLSFTIFGLRNPRDTGSGNKLACRKWLSSKGAVDQDNP